MANAVPFHGVHSFFNALQSLSAWLVTRPARARGKNSFAQPPRAASVVRPSVRPLRVVRVFDGPRVPQGAGRMVISGRMADVCAELDRLADLEAARR
jgi:hypothetical protein